MLLSGNLHLTLFYFILFYFYFILKIVCAALLVAPSFARQEER